MSSLRPRLNVGGQGKPDQLGETARPHLVHDPRAVDLDGAWANLQIVGNRFVRQPGQETFQYDAIDGSDTLQMMTISAGFEGTYPQITRLVNLIDKSPRFFVIDSMQASAPQQNAQKLTVQLKIKTFVRGAPSGQEANS